MLGEKAACCADEVKRLGREPGSTNAALAAWSVRLQQGKADESPVAFTSLLEEIGRWSVEPSQWDCCFASIYAYSGLLDRARFHVDQIMAEGLDGIPQDSEWVGLMWRLAEAVLALADRQVAAAIRERLAPYAEVWAADGFGDSGHGSVSELVDRLDAFLAEPRPTAGPQSVELAESAELHRDGRVWHVAFRGRQATIPHSKGLTDLATLLVQPGREVHVLDLVEASGGPARAAAGGDSGPVLDRQARAAYQRRLADLQEDLDDAVADADDGRIAKLTEERDHLLAELAGALGLGGRDRHLGDTAERARKAVTMRISTAHKAIAETHPELAQHLRLAVSTGRFCCYRPERPVVWRI
jgi:hypothetical protein